jgi:hypothetical protein
VSVIIRIRIFQEMNLVNNLSIFLHRCSCGWHSCAFTRVWFYQLGILLFCFCPVAMYHPICLLALVIFILHFLLLSTFCLPVLLFYICNWNEFVLSVHVLHILQKIVFSYEIAAIWIISITECSACYLNSSEVEYDILYINTLS